MSNIDKLLYIDGIGEITQNLNIGGNLNVTETLFTKKLGIGTSNIGIGTVFYINGDTTVQGNIIPSDDNTYTLGSISRAFKDVYIGPGSLYVNGKKVIEDSSDTITVTTTHDQNLQFKTTGSGALQLITHNTGDITLNSSNDVEIITDSSSNGSIKLETKTTNSDIKLISKKDILLDADGTSQNIFLKIDSAEKLVIDTTNTTIENILKVDTINEKTNGNGVTIEGVLLKDNTLNSTNITGNVTGNITSDTTISGLLSITKENTNNIRIDNISGDIIYDVASGNEHIFDINGNGIARFTSTEFKIMNGATKTASISNTGAATFTSLNVSTSGINASTNLNLKVNNTNAISIISDKINMYKPLYMNSQAIYFQPNDPYHYIKYSNENNMDGVEIVGYGGNDQQYNRALLRVKSSRTDDVNMECFPQDPANTNPTTNNPNVGSTTHIYNKLSVLRGGVTGQNDGNDVLTVKNTGFCKAIIHSDNNDTELALKCGNDNSNQAVIKRLTNDRFLISNQGEFRTVANNHNFFNNNSDASNGLRLAFQTDSNLVVYDNSTVKFASNDSQNAHSSRDYKKNINDLVESESIDIIKNLNPVSFEYLEKYWSKHDSCNACGCNLRKGFIWEDTKPILPQATRTINMDNPDEETTKTLDLKMVIPDLTKTVQYLLNKVETQESTISTLIQQLTTQSTLISNLQSQIDSN